MKTLNDRHTVSNIYLSHESIAALERQMLDIILYNDSFDSLAPCLAVTAAKYHLATGGQRIRAFLALHAGNCLGLTAQDSQTLAAACELLHNASLIHDDLHDRDIQRRGLPSVWAKFGDEVAIYAGDLLISASYLALSQLVDVARMSKLFALMHARVEMALRGQCADLSRLGLRDITLDDFKSIALSKSGALLSLPTELVLLAANEDLALPLARQATAAFAVAYQIFDDLADVEADAYCDPVKAFTTNQSTDHTGTNIVRILQSDTSCKNARMEAIKIGLQYLSIAASVCPELPSNSGEALHAMCSHLQGELEYLE